MLKFDMLRLLTTFEQEQRCQVDGGHITRLILAASFFVCLQSEAVVAQNQRAHPTRLALEVMGGAFHLWSPPQIRNGYAGYAISGGAGVGVLLNEDVYVGVRGVFGEFEHLEESHVESGGDMYFLASEAVGKVFVPGTLVRVGPLALRLAVFGRSGIHVVGRRAGTWEGASGRSHMSEQHDDTRFSVGGGGGIEFRYRRQAAFFVDATYSLVYDGDWIRYTPLAFGLRLAGGPE